MSTLARTQVPGNGQPLTITEILAARAVCRFVGYETGRFYARHDTLAQAMKRSRYRVIEGLKALRERGVIEWQRTGRCSQYVVNMPRLVALVVRGILPARALPDWCIERWRNAAFDEIPDDERHNRATSRSSKVVNTGRTTREGRATRQRVRGKIAAQLVNLGCDARSASWLAKRDSAAIAYAVDCVKRSRTRVRNVTSFLIAAICGDWRTREETRQREEVERVRQRNAIRARSERQDAIRRERQRRVERLEAIEAAGDGREIIAQWRADRSKGVTNPHAGNPAETVKLLQRLADESATDSPQM